MSTLIPSCAAHVVPGKSVIRTFDGDVLVTDRHVARSGFHLLELEGQRIRPYYAIDVVYLVVPEDGAA